MAQSCGCRPLRAWQVAFTDYVPERLKIGRPHPDAVVEVRHLAPPPAHFRARAPRLTRAISPSLSLSFQNSTLSSVRSPAIRYNLKILELHPRVVDEARLSALQLETVVYASQQHSELFSDGTRKGFFCGDGAGIGKGRQLAGTILENWLHGRTKHVWLSVSNGELTLCLLSSRNSGHTFLFSHQPP